MTDRIGVMLIYIFYVLDKIMEIIKLNECYSILSTHENWEYRGNIDHIIGSSIKINITINDLEGTLCGSVSYDLNFRNISTITYDRIPQDKEKKFTDYINIIIQEVLKTFGIA